MRIRKKRIKKTKRKRMQKSRNILAKRMKHPPRERRMEKILRRQGRSGKATRRRRLTTGRERGRREGRRGGRRRRRSRKRRRRPRGVL